jgi:hypothetical protein
MLMVNHPVNNNNSIHGAINALEAHTGVVIPVYLGSSHDREAALTILSSTVQMFVREVNDPQNICLSVDGPEAGSGIAAEIVKRYGVQMVVGERNRGKFGALLHGMQTLLADERLAWFAAVDQDGDHFGNDLLNFMRAALHIVENANNSANDSTTNNAARVMVLGNRASRHRPLGFLRAEQEALCNLVLMDALTYAATLRNQPLHLEYLTTIDPLPDFHSGYKFFSRATAQAVFAQEPPLMQLSEAAAYRHACEAVMTVEAYLSGATLAAINRRTFDEQPISLFASYNRANLAADMILWPCKRLHVPGHFVAQWLANHMPTLLLGTLAPQGQDELLAIRQLVLQGYNLDPATIQPAPFTRPRFV